MALHYPNHPYIATHQDRFRKGIPLLFVLEMECSAKKWTIFVKQTKHIFPWETSFLYSENSPLNRTIVWLRIVHNSLHTRLIKNWSCDTTTTPPLNLLSAFANASIVSTCHTCHILSPISKWLVGSSNTRICGFVFVIIANETLVFWPPLSVLIFLSAISTPHSHCSTPPSFTPNRANWLLNFCSSSFG